jgi:DNA-binding MarR family transcriptional regulator
MTARPEEVAALVATVFEVAGELRRVGETEAATAGQTQARWQVLSVVSDGEWTVPRAARRLGIKRQSVQRTVDLLVDDGLVTLHENPHHARSPLVRLTPAGRRVLDRINRVADEWHRDVARRLDRHALETTQTTLGQLLAAARASA